MCSDISRPACFRIWADPSQQAAAANEQWAVEWDRRGLRACRSASFCVSDSQLCLCLRDSVRYTGGVGQAIPRCNWWCCYSGGGGGGGSCSAAAGSAAHVASPLRPPLCLSHALWGCCWSFRVYLCCYCRRRHRSCCCCSSVRRVAALMLLLLQPCRPYWIVIQVDLPVDD